MSRAISIWTLGLLLTCCSSVFAAPAEDVLEEQYGRGVHYYFTGNFVQAHKVFTETIESGILDPRAYYFRGLSCLNLGRAPDARADFSKGAQMEVAETARFYDVSRSLERVQGNTRAIVESYRSEARVAAAHRREQVRAKRYESTRRAMPAAPATPAAPAPGNAAAPAADPGAAPATPAEPGAAPAKPADNPFAP